MIKKVRLKLSFLSIVGFTWLLVILSGQGLWPASKGSPSLTIHLGPPERFFGGPNQWAWGLLEAADMHVPFLKSKDEHNKRLGDGYYLWTAGWFSDAKAQNNGQRYAASIRLRIPALNTDIKTLQETVTPDPSEQDPDSKKLYAVPVLSSALQLPLEGEPGPSYTHEEIWIGGVWYNPDTGKLLAICHMEEYYEPNSFVPWYGSIGVATSDNFGKTFSRPQKILTSPLSFYEAQKTKDEQGHYRFLGYVHPTVVPVTEADGKRYLYVYSGYDGVGVVVARSPIHGTSTGMPGTWQAYNQGRWSAPGLGGHASRLLGEEMGGASMSVSYNDYLKRYVLVFINDMGEETEQGIYLTTSSDGLHWSPPQMIFKANPNLFHPSQRSVNFPSMIGITKDSSQETSKDNWLFYMVGEPAGPRALYRRKVVLEPS